MPIEIYKHLGLVNRKKFHVYKLKLMSKVLRDMVLVSILFFTTISLSKSQEISVKGLVYKGLSMRTPVVGVRVVADGADSDHTDEFGRFELKFSHKKPGELLNIHVGEIDQNHNVISVVNIKQLELLRLPNHNYESPIIIIVCDTNKWNETVIGYYGAIVNHSLEEYSKRFNHLSSLVESYVLDTIEWSNEIAKLQLERDEALNLADSIARELCNIDKDVASELVKLAMSKIEVERDIRGALDILSNYELKKAYEENVKRKEAAIKGIIQIIVGYRLRINLLKTEFRFDEALEAYQVVNRIFADHELDKLIAADWLSSTAETCEIAGRFNDALRYQLEALKVRNKYLDSCDARIMHSLYSIGVAYSRLEKFEEAIEYHLCAISMMDSTKSSETMARYYAQIAYAYVRNGECEKALKYATASHRILDQKNINGILRYNLYDIFGLTYRCLGRYDIALDYQLKGVMGLQQLVNRNNPDLATCYFNIGLTYADIDNFDCSIEFHNKALEIRETVLMGTHPYIRTSYELLGMSYHNNGQYVEATRCFRRALSLKDVIPKLSLFDEARIYHYLGFDLLKLGECDESISMYDEAIKIREKSSKYPYLFAMYLEKGNALDCQGRHSDAESIQLKAIELHEIQGTGKPTDMIWAYENLAYTYNKLGNQESSVEYKRKAIELRESETTIDYSALLQSYESIADSYFELEDYPEVINYYHKALVIGMEYGISDSLSLYNYNQQIGASYHYLGYYAEASDYHRYALTIAENFNGTDPSRMSLSNNWIGSDLYQLGDYEAAAGYFWQALEELKPDTQSYILEYSNFIRAIGDCYDQMGSIEDGLDCHWHSARNAEMISEVSCHWLGGTYTRIGLDYSQLGERSFAISCFNEAVSMFSITDSINEDVAMTYHHLGNEYSLSGDYSKALVYHMKDLYISKVSLSNDEVLGYCYKCVANDHYHLKNYKNAVLFQELAVDLLKNIPRDRRLSRDWKKSLRMYVRASKD